MFVYTLNDIVGLAFLGFFTFIMAVIFILFKIQDAWIWIKEKLKGAKP